MNPGTVQVLRTGLWIVVVLLIWGLVAREAYGQIPADATRYKRDLVRNARLAWGLDAPTATFAGQIHQESGWRADAVSPAGATGMAQFMPTTVQWISGLHPELRDAQPTNPSWALRALVEYDKWLYDRVPLTWSHCERMAFVLSSYNGGLGWLQKDVALAAKNGADPQLWFEHVERFNGGRAGWAFAENRSYPNRILLELERRYARDGWGIKSC